MKVKLCPKCKGKGCKYCEYEGITAKKKGGKK
jgi:hypothetical protein